MLRAVIYDVNGRRFTESRHEVRMLSRDCRAFVYFVMHFGYLPICHLSLPENMATERAWFAVCNRVRQDRLGHTEAQTTMG